jgi:hypothetical protein
MTKMSGPYQESSHKTSGLESGHYINYAILAPLFCESLPFFERHLDGCQMVNTATFILPLLSEAIYQLPQGSTL